MMNLDRLFQDVSLVGQRCWYRVPYTENLTFSKIKEVETKVTNRGQTVYLTLNNGVTAVLHTHGCPDYIGRDKVWGFLTQKDCNDYWDM